MAAPCWTQDLRPERLAALNEVERVDVGLMGFGWGLEAAKAALLSSGAGRVETYPVYVTSEAAVISGFDQLISVKTGMDII